MAIAFQCTNCRKAFSVSDTLAGKKAKCKQCGQLMLIPEKSPDSRPVDLYDLDAAPLPPRGAVSVDDEPPIRRPSGDGAWGNPAKKKSRPSRWSTFLGNSPLRTVLVVLVTVAGVGARIHRTMQRNQNRANPATVAAPQLVDPNAPIVMPNFPELPAAVEVEPGVMFRSVAMGPSPPGPGVLPGHGMHLWLYTPTGAEGAKSLPCVMIAPAGSILIVGNELDAGKGDHPEHLPYVRAGFAVLAYGLDGELHRHPGLKITEVRPSVDTFLAARASLTNAEIALAWVLAKVPQVDPERIYTAGHSSAGTMALLLAENEPRIKACAAFAPRSDIAQSFNAEETPVYRTLIPEIEAMFTTYNPKTNAAKIGCPVLLFHARDDSVVPAHESEAFADDLRRLGKSVKVEMVPSGNHYQPMISQGIPLAIAWFKEMAGMPPDASAPATPAPAAPASVSAPPAAPASPTPAPVPATAASPGAQPTGPLGSRLRRFGPNRPGMNPDGGGPRTPPFPNRGFPGSRRGPRLPPMGPMPQQ